jgi:multiple sugar transport system substrate-binding protein
MEEIELSVMVHTPGTAETLRGLLDEFQAKSNIRVNLTCLDWVTARAELNKAALYHHGPDVSEVGSTWVPDLISMHVLNPLLPHEIAVADSQAEFVRACWETVQTPEDRVVWALPWHAETYIIHYRRDLLQTAGVAEATAFKTQAEIEVTAQKLAKIGVPVPVELTLQTDRYGTLHALASWVWANGGQFLSADSKRILLDQPKGLAAIQSYFGLLRHASAEGRQAMLGKTHAPLFHQGLSAITFGTMRMAMPEGEIPPEVSANRGWAALPQPCFVGGSNIVVWKHTRQKRAALKLVEFLTSPASLARSNPAMATLPPRLAVLDNPEYQNDPMLSVMSRAIQGGRAYPPLRLWGLVEDKLVAALLQIGAEALTSPADMEKIILREVESVTHRLGMILSQ